MISIPKEGDDQYQKMQGRLGGAAMEFVLELAHKLNELEARTSPAIVTYEPEEGVPSYSVNPPEEKHAGSQTKAESSDQRLPRSEPGK